MKRIGWGVAIVLGLLLVGNALMAWRVEGQIAAKKRAIRAAGDPASIAELRPAPIPVPDNAAARIAQVHGLLDAFAEDHHNFLSKTDLGKAFEAASERGESMTGEQAEAIRALLDKHAPLAAAIEQAAALDSWASQLDFTLGHTAFIEKMLEPVQKIRTAGRMIDWQMRLSVHDGKLDQAVAQGIVLLRLARLHEREPTLVNFLVTIAMRGVALRGLYGVLAAGPVSPEMHAALDEELARADGSQSFVAVLKSERALVIDAVETGMMPPVPQALGRTIGWVAKRHFLGSMDFMDQLIVESAKPWQEFRKSVKGGGPLQPFSKYGTIGELLAPAITATVQARERDLTQIRALRVFNSLRAYADENGREATGLSDLSIAAPTVTDPVNGAPLILKLTDAGWLVYGVGENRRDDGGKIESPMDDYGLGPRVVRAAAEDADSAEAGE
jgi:hypothetical protein